MKKTKNITIIENVCSMSELCRLMGVEPINNHWRLDMCMTYERPFRSMHAHEFGADIHEDWRAYQKRLETNPETHRRRLNVHGIFSYNTMALVVGYYTDETGKTETVAAALYGYSTTTSRQITTYLQDECWSPDEITELKAACK